jgi:xanthine dehydrogenase accessory factor
MTGSIELRSRADDLRALRQPFVNATVVRAERPTSAKPGDTALVLADGTVVGFVGGECAEASVQVHALGALADGKPVLLRIRPDADGPADEVGSVTVHNPCLSGGTLEIFLEPELPPPLVAVHGEGPIARALVDLAEHLGYATAGGVPDDAEAVVVASHGRGEADVLVTAVRSGVPYVALVASARRGAAVLAGLDLTEEERARVHTPAGIDIGARTPAEAALAILAEIVSVRPAPPPADPVSPPDGPVATAVDPVCGMTVAAVDSSLHLDHEGRRRWFCGSGCRDAFAADPGAFADR